MIGRAQGVVVENFDDYTDGDAITKLNKFIKDNPDITIIDIKYFNGYSVTDNQDPTYGRENATIIYREPVDTYGAVFSKIENEGLVSDKEIKLEKVVADIFKKYPKLVDKYKK